MDRVFWYGIGIGAFLSLIASILANLANLKINNFLETQRLKLGLRKETKEIKIYKLVCDLHSGKRNIVIFFCTRIVNITCQLLCALALSGLSLYAATRFVSQPDNMIWWFDFNLFLEQIPSLIALLGFMFGFYSSIRQIRYLREIGSKIDEFDDYKTELQIRFSKSDFWMS